MDLAFVYVAKGLEVSFKVLNKVPADATIGWDFGVEGGESQELNPIYTYEKPGCYTVTLTVEVQGVEEKEVSTVSQTILVSDSDIKTHLNDSIYNLIDLYVPANLVDNGMTLQQKATFIQKWQLYIGPLVERCIPIEEYTNELYYEGLENQLIMELAVWDFLNMQIISLLTGTGQYIDSLTYQSQSKTSGEGEGEDEPGGDEQGSTSRVKRIQTGPTEVEYFDELSDSLSTLYKSYSEALKPNGIIEVLRKNLCNLASRLMIFLPMCDNAYRPTKVPRVVNRRHPRGIDGPNPPTILSHR